MGCRPPPGAGPRQPSGTPTPSGWCSSRHGPPIWPSNSWSDPANSQARSGLACLRDTIAEQGWPPLIWTRPDGYRSCSDPAELQAYEVAVIREKLSEIRRFITAVVAPHAALQRKGRWVRHLNTQLNSVESTLDVIADYIDA